MPAHPVDTLKPLPEFAPAAFSCRSCMTWMQLADWRQSVPMPNKTMGRNPLLLACAIAALTVGSALAQHSVQPLPKVGG